MQFLVEERADCMPRACPRKRMLRLPHDKLSPFDRSLPPGPERDCGRSGGWKIRPPSGGRGRISEQSYACRGMFMSNILPFRGRSPRKTAGLIRKFLDVFVTLLSSFPTHLLLRIVMVLGTIVSLDLQISLFINSFVGDLPSVDQLLHIIERNSLFKGVFSMMLFWSLWFAVSKRVEETRARLLATLAVSVLAVFVGRVLAVMLPYRPRPIHDPELGFVLHGGLTHETLDGWSSMPSDHAVLYFALATGIFLAHRAAGVVALVHAIFIICLPRVFFGLHYAADIAVGAVIGILIAVALVPWLARQLQRHDIPTYAATHGGLFYPAVFFITWQVASMFGPVRDLLRDLAAMLA
ncbi:phosphatase PAP2 family protein [Rhodobacter sp. NSM]|uniref:phosphatase PAP2 family protein n=1 Tax=Rhodobacter sp. NSM TaxID=3457501 RepID=UPI003FD23A2A